MKLSRLLTMKSFFLLIALLGLFWVSPDQLYSQVPTGRGVTTTPAPTPMQQAMNQPYDNLKRPSLITQATALTVMSLLPFIVMILTSFLKIVIVLSLLRSASPRK